MLANIIIANATRKFDREYTYIVPLELQDKILVGSSVVVPFGNGNRLVKGLVTELLDEDKKTDGKYALKEITRIIEELPIVLSTHISLLKWMKERYVSTYYVCMKSVLPTYLEKSSRMLKVAKLNMSGEQAEKLLESNDLKTLNQVYVIEYLLVNGESLVTNIINDIGISEYTINSLNKKGFIEIYKVKEQDVRPIIEQDGLNIERKEINLNQEQLSAIEKIGSSLKSEVYSKYLLKGVTGSGKTEVYMNLIEKCISSGKQAIVLVPEISLTPLMIARFKARFGEIVTFLHSKMTPREKRENWNSIRNNKVKIAIGPRSAVFSPFDNLGIIIIDEEHETTYKSETNPKYNAKEVAEFLCMENKATLVLGSATPLIESMYEAEVGNLELVELKNRTSIHGLPDVEIVDMRQELNNGNRSMFSKRLSEEIEENLVNGEQTIIFLNRRGYNSFVLCRQCGESIRCTHCSTTMTLHAKNNRLVCHQCGRTKVFDGKCPSCGSSKIKAFGVGTQKVEEEIIKTFPSASVIRMDMDTTSKKNGHLSILKEFDDKKIDILVGTQMIAKGHDFENVTLVGVLAADSSLNVQDFRAAEKTFEIISQVSGRAGRGRLKGRVLVQTYNTDAYAISDAKTQDYDAFYSKEINVRKVLSLPPFTHLAVVLVQGINQSSVIREVNNVATQLKKMVQIDDDFMIIGPAPAINSKINGKNRYNITIKAKDERNLRDKCRIILDDNYERLKKQDIDISIDINPYNIL